jgi:LysM repeat protein
LFYRTLVRNRFSKEPFESEETGAVEDMNTQPAAVSPATYARRRLVLVLTLALATFAAISFATGQAQASNQTSVSQTTKFTYVSVHVGDTLWSLADAYAGETDQRDWIANLVSLNNLASNNLQPGQRLALPLG